MDVFSATLASALKNIREIDVVGRFMVEYDVSLFETVKNATGPLMVEVDKTPGSDFGLVLKIFDKHDSISNIQKRGVFIDHVIPASIADRYIASHFYVSF